MAPRELQGQPPLTVVRERAERGLNIARAFILTLLAVAAATYAPSLPPALNLANFVVLGPMLAWTVGQYLVFYRQERLPDWLFIANPVVDITGVTAILVGYGVAASGALALKSPMVLAYLVILAARPITSSTRHATLVASLVIVEYVAVTVFFISGGSTPLTDPVHASVSNAVSLLDEGVTLLLLCVAGGIAIFATAWHEQLARRYAVESLEREELRVRLAASELESLKLQLHPHFLFNTLNVISALIHTDARAAERMIAGLSELIRVALYSVSEQEVPLHRELEVLGHYIDIQQIRFEDRLTINTHIEPDVRDILVPQLILQPLVENAIKHGIAPRATPGRIDITATRVENTVHISVVDNGVGLRDIGPGAALGAVVERVGLGNARARLRHLYGDQQALTIDVPPGGGFAVHVTVPFRRAQGTSALSEPTA